MGNKYKGISIFSDFDGTLSDIPNSISAENKKGVEYFIENGGKFSLATGKILKNYQDISFCCNGPMIFSNGSQIYDLHKNEYIKEYFIKDCCEELLKDIYDKYENVGIVIHGKERLICFKNNGIFRFDGSPWFDGVYSLEEINRIKNEIIMFSVCGLQEDVDLVKNYVNSNYDDVDAMVAFPGFINVVKKGVNKGTALKYLKDNYYDKNNMPIFICLGDGENDINLLKQADYPIAVDNADVELKSIAKHILKKYTEPCMPQVLDYIDKNILKIK